MQVKDSRLPPEYWANDRCPDFATEATHQHAPDYKINASFVLDKRYIVTQCPTRDTVDDFFGLVLANNVRHVVCLCNFDRESTSYDYRGRHQFLDKPYKVKFDRGGGWAKIFCKSDRLPVWEFCWHQYPNWEDCGANLPDVGTLSNFVNSVPHDDQGPVLVHCLMGVNRSATFVMLHYLTGLEFVPDQPTILKIIDQIRKKDRRVFLIYQPYMHYVLSHYQTMIADRSRQQQQ